MIAAILLGAGSGLRFGGPISKQFMMVGGRSLLEYSALALFNSSLIDSLIYVAKSGEEETLESILGSYPGHKLITLGGAERSHSVLNGLRACDPNTEFVLIHDGVRPNLSPKLVHAMIMEVKELSIGIVPVIPISDTIKQFDGEYLLNTVNREELVQVQTPQAYPYRMILEAYEKGLEEGYIGTDDAAYAYRYGIPVKAIQGNVTNLKITNQEDLNLFEYYLSRGIK